MPSRFGGLWRRPDFVKLWAGETISIFGSLIGGLALQFTAVVWLHASPLELALLVGCQFVPGFFVGLLAGAWVDRVHRWSILIAADIGRALALATVPLSALLGVLSVQPPRDALRLGGRSLRGGVSPPLLARLWRAGGAGRRAGTGAAPIGLNPASPPIATSPRNDH